MKIVSKDFFTFTGFYRAINVGPCRRSCITIVWKFGTSEMLEDEVPHPSSPISNCPTIQTVDIFFPLVREPTCPSYLLNLFVDNFKSFTMFINLTIGWHVNFADLGVRLRLSTFRIIFPRFLRTVISPDFKFLLTGFLGSFFQVYFLHGLRKKEAIEKKNCKKRSSKLSPCSHSI